MKQTKRKWIQVGITGQIFASEKEADKYEEILRALFVTAWNIFEMSAKDKGMKFKSK